MREIKCIYAGGEWVYVKKFFNHFKTIDLCDRIVYHCPTSEGGKHYCDVHYEGGIMTRYLNIEFITFDKEKSD